jgi:hypothetical protein
LGNLDYKELLQFAFAGLSIARKERGRQREGRMNEERKRGKKEKMKEERV